MLSLLLCAAQVPAQIAPSAAIRNASLFSLLLTDDGKGAFTLADHAIHYYPLTGSELDKPVTVKSYHDPKGQVVFYSSVQTVPADVAKHPTSAVEIDSAWEAPSRRYLVLSAHQEKGRDTPPDTMYAVLVDLEDTGQKPLLSAAVTAKTQWGLFPLAMRMSQSTMRWWLQLPTKGEEANLTEYDLDISTGALTHSAVAAMPSLRFTLYCPEAGLAADYNSLLHYVSTWQKGAGDAAETVHTPAETLGFCLTPSGVCVPTQAGSLFQLQKGKWNDLGKQEVVGWNASGSLGLIRTSVGGYAFKQF